MRGASAGFPKFGAVEVDGGFNLDDRLGTLLGFLFQPNTDWHWLKLTFEGEERSSHSGLGLGRLLLGPRPS